MPKTVEESLLGDHSEQWTDSDCPEAKRLKVYTIKIGYCHHQLECTQYFTLEHLFEIR